MYITRYEELMHIIIDTRKQLFNIRFNSDAIYKSYNRGAYYNRVAGAVHVKRATSLGNFAERMDLRSKLVKNAIPLYRY